jgi:NAD(P)H-nitrite reductase large subunit
MESCVACYVENGKKKERTSRFMDRFGVEAFKQAVL